MIGDPYAQKGLSDFAMMEKTARQTEAAPEVALK